MTTITSTANPLVKRLRALSSASRRERGGLVLLEGVRLCEEALAAGRAITDGLIDSARLRRSGRGAALADRLIASGALDASGAVLDSVSDTVTSQGVVIAVEEPRFTWPEPAGPVVLVLDGVRDPGNVGTILRSAAASGLVRVVVTIDCADPWGTKAVRSALGAHFRLALWSDSSVEEARARAPGLPWLVADADGGLPYEQVDWRQDCVLVVGGEAEGASAAVKSLADARVTIPMAASAESLNAAVAASVLLFEAARARRS